MLVEKGDMGCLTNQFEEIKAVFRWQQCALMKVFPANSQQRFL